MKWKREAGSAVQAPISHGGTAHNYVISHRQGQHNVSYNPPGVHEHVGTFATEKEAKTAAAAHARGERKAPTHAAGPAVPRGESRGRAPRRKSKAQLNREIAQSLAASGQGQLAAMFGSPEGRKAFAQEMRHQIQTQQAAERTRAAVAARPYVVTRLEQWDKRRVRALLGRYPTLEAARAAADRVDGWVEHDGKVIYGVEKQSDPSPED